MPWYAVRSVYHFGVKFDGTNVFEERVVAVEANGWADAQARGEAEANRYATENNVAAHPQLSIYEQTGTPLVDGYALWSELFESPLPLEAFYAARYAKFEYQPEM